MTETMEPAALAEIYRRAAIILETKGWGCGQNVGANGQRCLTAAINEADERSHWLRSDDLFRSLAGWLVTNRTDDLRAALIVMGYHDNDESLARIMQGAFAPEDAWWGARPIRVCQSWNDARSSAITRTRDEVVSVLRQVADHLVSAEA